VKLDAHLDRLDERVAPLDEAYETSLLTGEKHSSTFGKLHPEALRADFNLLKEIGKTVIELARTAPHLPQIYRERKQLKKEGKL
jgi:hypothetical protein